MVFMCWTPHNINASCWPTVLYGIKCTVCCTGVSASGVYSCYTHIDEYVNIDMTQCTIYMNNERKKGYE